MQKRRKCLHVCQSFYVLGMTNGQCSLPDCIQFVLPYYCRRLLWLIFIHFSCSRKKCWLFSLLETLFFILMKRESGKQIFFVIFSRVLCKVSFLFCTLELLSAPISTYVVKAWKMNSDVIYHKEPGWCSVSICCCQELKESSKNSYRCSMTFKNKVHYGPEYIWLMLELR